MRRILAWLLIAGATLTVGVPPAPAAPNAGRPEDSLVVTMSRTQVANRLGDSFDFTSTIRNAGRTASPKLVAHLNVVGLSSDVYVDPEDWSSERTRFLEPLRPGQSTRVSWKVESVNGGDIAIYVAVLSDRGNASETLAVGPALDLHVTERKTLNSEGVLPLALGIPGFLGLLMIGLRARRRRAR